MNRTALVTGGNRGIGLEVCRQLAKAGLRVILAARDSDLGRQAAQELASAGLAVSFERLDVSLDASVTECEATLRKANVQVDVLVNNAAIYPSGNLLDTEEPDLLREAMEINFFGAVRTCRAFVPGMRRAGYGRVVNVSSGSGAFSSGLPGPAPYSVSKAALNAFTLKLASEVRGNLKVNASCPGWVRTRMGGRTAPRSVEQGADTIVWLATLAATGPNGGFFRDRQRIEW